MLGIAISEKAEDNVRATSIDVTGDIFTLGLSEGSPVRIRLSLASPSLAKATPEQRARVRFIGRGVGLHWPDIDEDLTVAGLVRKFGG
jgi:Protein of unknown function (DUF2442)